MEHRQDCEVDNNEVVEIKIENESLINIDNQECERTKTFEQLFIKQEDDEHNETIEALNRIKSEPNDVDWDKYDPDYKNILEVEMENNKLDMEMQNQELIFKKDSNKNIDAISGIASSRIKSEYTSIDNSNECETHENQDLNIQLSRMKREIDMDTEGFQATEITEEFAIKNEGDTSADGASNSMAESKIPRQQHRGSSKRIDRKTYSCYNCDYTTSTKRHLISHLKAHDNEKYRPVWPNLCIHCSATFKNRLSLDDHVVKRHPEFIASVHNEVFKCTRCVYKTTVKHNFNRHLSIHSSSASTQRLRTCIHCNESFINKASLEDHIAREHPGDKSVHTGINCMHCTKTFKKRIALDDHIVKIHPTFITSVTSKLHQCTKCAFKTTLKNHLQRHESLHAEASEMPVHSEADEISQCNHCNATFKNKMSLVDHVAEKHPDFVTSVTSVLYDCIVCGYKSAGKVPLKRHIMLVHPEISPSFNQPIMCVHCNVKFTKKASLDSHVVKKHPQFITSISNKLYECTDCTYQTTLRGNFNRHLLTHSIAHQRRTCIYCDACFKTKRALNHHIAREHPGHGEIYACTKCSYKTTFKKTFRRHNLLEHGITDVKLNKCIHCTESFKNKESLDDHIHS